MPDHLNIRAFRVGALETNCYIADLNGEAFAVDPGDSGREIAKLLKEENLQLRAILLTHGHYDHILGVNDLSAAFPEAQIVIGQAERAMIEDPSLNCGFFNETAEISPDRFVDDGDELLLIGRKVQVFVTPGHTAGSVCYYLPEEEILFSGDTVFRGSYGRIDLPTGSPQKMGESLRRILTELPAETAVFPGHGPETTVGFEKMIEGY